jgi:SAM-dependent methyltransferase
MKLKVLENTRKVLSADEPASFLRLPPRGDLTPEQIRAHYLVEKDLARQLMDAGKEDRRILYNKLYDELFEKVPFHPQIRKKQDPAYSERQLQSQLKLLRRFFDKQKVFLEIGAGDCALSRAVADHFRLVYAVDVSEQISRGNGLKENVRFALSDGTSIPVPAGTIDLAYSNQLMEHLHPDDAAEQLGNIYAALAPGGSYLCITPNRLSGPHDVSRYFDEVATGFHLKEYVSSELRQMFSDAGFTNCQVLIGFAGQYRRLPAGNFFHSILEGVLRCSPRRLRQQVVSLSPVNSALGLVCIAQKPGRR